MVSECQQLLKFCFCIIDISPYEVNFILGIWNSAQHLAVVNISLGNADSAYQTMSRINANVVLAPIMIKPFLSSVYRNSSVASDLGWPPNLGRFPSLMILFTHRNFLLSGYWYRNAIKNLSTAGVQTIGSQILPETIEQFFNNTGLAMPLKKMQR